MQSDDKRIERNSWSCLTRPAPPRRPNRMLKCFVPKAAASGAVLLIATAVPAAGNLAIYLADKDTDNVYELYHVNPATGSGGKVNSALVAGGEVYRGLVHPKGTSVIYEADQEVDGVFRLWKAEISTGAVTPLSPPFASSSTYGFSIDAKGLSLVYVAEQDTVNIPELYRVDLKTGVNTKLSPPLEPGGMVKEFYLQPKGRFVVYRANLQSGGADELYRVDLKTGNSQKISGPLEPNGDVTDFKVDAKGSAVFYIADADNVLYELYRADLKTGNVLKISGPLQPNGEVLDFQIDPKGANAVYLADQDTDEVRELYRVLLKTGRVTKLNPPLVGGGNVARDDGFRLDAKGRFVVYLADQETDHFQDMFKADLKTGVVTKLNPLFANPTSVAGDPKAPISRSVKNFEIHPKSGSVVYVADQEVDNRFELFLVNLKTGDTDKISVPRTNPGITQFKIEPSGAGVLFRENTDTSTELFRFDLKSRGLTTLNGTLVSGGAVHWFNVQGALSAYW